MRPRNPALIVGLLLLLTPPTVGNARQTEESDAVPVATFQSAVLDYVALRDAATQSLPPLKNSLDPGIIRAAMRARAEAIRAARPRASAGELFTPAVGDLFRRRIAAVLAQYNVSEDEVLNEGEDWDDGESVPMVVVNEAFPWERAGRMLSCVLLALPTLPDGLEYRFVGTSLVLVDVDASLVVDVLPDVLRRSLRVTHRPLGEDGSTKGQA